VSEVRRIPIRTEFDASRSVLESASFARAAGFGEAPSMMISTAVSELTRNILKYAGIGELRMRVVEGEGTRGIEIESHDQGPGIADPESAMRDHFSSSGTLGLGLPGVKRMMDEFELDAPEGVGTRVRAVKWI
jgi:serine/threonine-protein kinase RsbT